MIKQNPVEAGMEFRQVVFFNILSVPNVVDDKGGYTPSTAPDTAAQLHNLVHGFSPSVPTGRVAQLTDSRTVPLRSMRVPLHGGLVPGWAPNGYGKTFVFGKLLSLISVASESNDPVECWNRYWDMSKSAVESTLGNAIPFSIMGLRVVHHGQAYDVLLRPPLVTPESISVCGYVRENSNSPHFSDHVWSYQGGQEWREFELFSKASAMSSKGENLEIITSVLDAFFNLSVEYIETPKLSSSEFEEYLRSVEEMLNGYDEITRQHWAGGNQSMVSLAQIEQICLEAHALQDRFFPADSKDLDAQVEAVRGSILQLEQILKLDIGNEWKRDGGTQFIDSFWTCLEPLLHQTKTHTSKVHTFSIFDELYDVVNRVVPDEPSRESMLVMRQIHELHALTSNLERENEIDLTTEKIESLFDNVFKTWNGNKADPIWSYLVYRCLLVMDSRDIEPIIGSFSTTNIDEVFTEIFELVNSEDLHEKWPWSSEGSVLSTWRFEALEESLRTPFDMEKVCERPYFSIPGINANSSALLFVAPKTVDSFEKALRLWPRTGFRPLPEVKSTLAAINRLLAEEGDPWSVTCRLLQSDSGRLQFIFHPTEQPKDSIGRAELSFGIRSEVVFRLSLMRFLFVQKHTNIAFQTINQRNNMRLEEVFPRQILVIDEPEVGRSEYWTSCLIDGLNDIDDKLEGLENASVFVISHRSSVLDNARRDGYSHNMHVDVGDEEE